MVINLLRYTIASANKVNCAHFKYSFVLLHQYDQLISSAKCIASRTNTSTMHIGHLLTMCDPSIVQVYGQHILEWLCQALLMTQRFYTNDIMPGCQLNNARVHTTLAKSALPAKIRKLHSEHEKQHHIHMRCENAILLVFLVMGNSFGIQCKHTKCTASSSVWVQPAIAMTNTFNNASTISRRDLLGSVSVNTLSERLSSANIVVFAAEATAWQNYACVGGWVGGFGWVVVRPAATHARGRHSYIYMAIRLARYCSGALLHRTHWWTSGAHIWMVDERVRCARVFEALLPGALREVAITIAAGWLAGWLTAFRLYISWIITWARNLVTYRTFACVDRNCGKRPGVCMCVMHIQSRFIPSDADGNAEVLMSVNRSANFPSVFRTGRKLSGRKAMFAEFGNYVEANRRRVFGNLTRHNLALAAARSPDDIESCSGFRFFLRSCHSELEVWCGFGCYQVVLWGCLNLRNGLFLNRRFTLNRSIIGVKLLCEWNSPSCWNGGSTS